MSGKAPFVVVAEDDQFIRVVQIVLDPRTTEERRAAFARFFAHDLPDFDGWCQQVRSLIPGVYPAEVRMVGTQEELRASLPGAQALVVESLEVGPEELAAADQLAVVQKFGGNVRNIDVAACEARGIKVQTVRRRANIACAEHTLALMLALAKKLNTIDGLISTDRLTEAGYSPTTFDRNHTANSGWARISGLKMLYESTLGIVGMGEIGRELALRASAFGMRLLYYQRNPLPPDAARPWQAEYVPLDRLLAESDWVSIQLPRGASTVGLIDRARLAQMKPGAFLINTAQANIIQRDALVEALASGHLGGFALDPLYEEPGSSDDPLLQFENVIITPHTAAQPRFNALNDLRDTIVGMASALRGNPVPGGMR